jgi:hypothetical protein
MAFPIFVATIRYRGAMSLLAGWSGFKNFVAASCARPNRNTRQRHGLRQPSDAFACAVISKSGRDGMSCWQVSAEALHPPTYELTKTT